MSDEVILDIKTGEVTRAPSPYPVNTPEQQAAYETAIATEANNEKSLRDQADQAITNLRAYRDLASPNNAQTVAAVKLLCRVAIALIRLALRKLDAAD